MMLIEALLNT